MNRSGDLLRLEGAMCLYVLQCVYLSANCITVNKGKKIHNNFKNVVLFEFCVKKLGFVVC
jgi:hypothetical protein